MQSPSQWGSKLRIYVTLSVVSGRSKSLSSVVGKDLARRCLRHRYYIIFLGEFYCNSSGSDSPRSVLLKFDVTASPGELSHGRGLNVHVHPKCSNRLRACTDCLVSKVAECIHVCSTVSKPSLMAGCSVRD